MSFFTRITIFWTDYVALVFGVRGGLENRYGVSVDHMVHRVLYRAACVRHDVRDSMRDDVRRKHLPGFSFLAAGARPIRIPARAQALMLHKAATGLRALGLELAALLRTATASLPAPRSRMAPAGQGQSQMQRGAQDRPSNRCERSLRFRSLCAARPAPDRRPTPSLCSVVPQAGGRARFALKRSTASVALGSAPSPVARWDSLLLLSRPASVSAGALPSPCAALGRLIALSGPVGACANFAKPAKFLMHSLQSLGLPPLCFTARAACARPNSRREFLPIMARAECVGSSNSSQSASSQQTNLLQRSNQSSCLSSN
jgi:hypothetical protein